MGKTVNIGGRIHNPEVGNVVAGANEILDDTKGKKQNVINSEVDTALAGLGSGKQDKLTFDQTPTESSTNPVTSGGVYAADQVLQQAIEAILLLIPSAASALNQLADKSFVNSSIATASATFRGTYNLVSDLHLSVSASHQDIATALASVVATADNNDYCFVQIPTSDTSSDIRVTERYKFNGTAWAYEYDLNNSGFTAQQWAAINSTITSALVGKLSALPTAAELATLLAGKQATLTFDSTPTPGSANPVTSGGLYDKFEAIIAKIPSDASANNKLVAENRLAAYVGGIIGALDATFDLTSTDGHVTLKITQTDGLIASVQVLTSDIASAAQVSQNTSDIAALQALYNALQQSAPEIIQPTDTWPVANPSTTVIYRVIDRVNTPPEYYSDYMFKASDLTTPVLMATYNNAIDPRPKKGSANLVTSGGVFDNMGALDVSELNATGGTLATYVDLSAALAAIPSDYQKGGMSIKFVQTSDNKYVQYRYMGTAVTNAEFLKIANWQNVDDIRFSSHDFQCFEKYKADGSDLFVPSSVYLCSSYYRAFIDLELYGFDKTVPHKLAYLSRNETASSIYRIIIYEYRNGSWSKTFDKSLNNVESNGNPNGINSVTWENSGKTVKALIDYSFIADNSGFTITPNASDPNFIIKKSCFKEQAIIKDYIEFDDLTIESVNLANPSNIQLDKEVRNNGRVYAENGYAVIGIPVSADQVITLGGFKLGRSGYYTVQDSSGEPITSSYGEFTDPNGTESPLTLTMPTGAAMLYFDIKTSQSPANPYAELMVNIGNSLMPYQPFEEKVTEIRDYPLAGDSISRSEIDNIENDIQELQEALFDTGGLIADLPVSADGTGIDVGHAYINSSTGVVTVKLS